MLKVYVYKDKRVSCIDDDEALNVIASLFKSHFLKDVKFSPQHVEVSYSNLSGDYVLQVQREF